MEIEPVPVKTVWSRADWVVLILFLIPLAITLLIYDSFAGLPRSRPGQRKDACM